MIAALFYLHFTQTWNRMRTRFQRLKKPKYLAGAVVGGLYFYFYFFRFMLRPPTHGRPTGLNFQISDFAALVEPLGGLLLFLFVLSAWIFPHQRAALVFTEAEATTLFSAPIRRRTLIHFKLLKSQGGILVTTLLFAFIGNRFGGRGHGWIHLGGWWIILSILNLHFLGASFTRTLLMEHGITAWRRRLGIFLMLGLVAGAVFLWAGESMRPPAEADLATAKAIAQYVAELLQAGPLPWLLYPFRLMLRPYLAVDLMRFLAAFWPTLILLVLHYIWVIRSEVSFEEASLALAQKRAQAISAAKQGQLPHVQRKARRDPFPLAPTGPPSMALLWKNLVAAGTLFHPRMWVVLGLALGIPALVIGMNAGRSGLGAAVGGMISMLFIWSLLLGPQLLRQDFRTDVKAIDLLKLYPLPGWRVVLGELLAPTVILTATQWLLLLLGGIVITKLPGGLEVASYHRICVGLCAAIIVPPLNFISLLIPNAAVLLFPAWFQSGQDATQGFEVAGQRIIFALGQVVVFGASLLPAGAIFTLVFLVSHLALQLHWAAALPLASLAASAGLLAEAAVGVGMLGRVFENFDLSSEPQN